MNEREEYLKKIDEIEKRSRFRKARQIYKEVHKKTNDQLYRRGEEFSTMPYSPEDMRERYRAEVAAVANELMKNDAIGVCLMGAQLYGKIGKGKKVIPRLIKATEKASRGYIISEDWYDRIKDFIKRNTEETPQSKSGLEGKIIVFILFTLVGIALSLSSLKLTGNAISNLTGTSQGLFGIFLFIAGLLGIVFSFRRR
jgi:hypothetical protein